MSDLSPTPRTQLGRLRDKGVADRAALLTLLSDALVAHVGVLAGDTPLVLPTAFGVDPDGPDEDGTLYLHGSVAARWLNTAVQSPVCVTVTEIEGIVAARSGFEHSVNYRSAVIFGTPRRVTSDSERAHALALIMDHLIPGRAGTLRPDTRKELAATQILAISLHEASLKARDGGPDDEAADIASGTWGGHIPIRRVYDPPVPDEHVVTDPPPDVVQLCQ